MKVFDKALGFASTASTFATNFWPWLVGSAVIGLAVGVYPTFKVTRAFYQRAALRAELNLSKFESSLTAARAENLQLSQNLANTILEKRDEDRNRLDAVAVGLRDLGQRVQLCATKSDVRVTVTPTGAITTVSDGQRRDLAEVVRDIAAACTVQRDKDAIDHNALVDWIEGLRKKASQDPSR